jgi:hypothetical protein
MSNPFEALAEAQIAKPVKRQQAATAKRLKTLLSKKEVAFAEKSAIRNVYHRQKAADQARAMATNRHGPELAKLAAVLDGFGMHRSAAMVAHVGSCKWLAEADSDARYWAVALVGYRIAAIRRAAGLLELDDPLPPHVNAFLRCRDIIRDA